MKKILALVLALAMVATLGLAFAAPSANAKDVKVTGLDKDDEVSFYQIVEWVGETDDDTDVTGWKAISPYDSVLDQTTLTAVLVGNPKADPVVKPTGITPELANALAKAATGTPDPIKANDSGEATLPQAEPGIYMALVKPIDVDTVYNPIFVSVDFTGANDQGATEYADSTAKKSELTLTKTASTTEDAWDDSKPTTTAIGDTVSFEVEATIPAYSTVYTNPHFAIKDELTDLTLDKGTVTVEGLTKGEDYTVDREEDDGYTITFTKDYLQGIRSATKVTVKYTAKVTTEAGYAINEETNEVMVEYSHDPHDESDYDVKKDTTQHYTFTIDAEIAGKGSKLTGKKTSEVVKIGVNADGTPINQTTEHSEITSSEEWNGPLEGAVFGLYTDSACENAYIPKKADGTSTGEALTATTGADGRMTFTGLDAGTYYIKEISAPAGYVTNSDAVEVKITATTKEISVTEWWNGSEWVSSKPGSGTAKEYTYKTDVLESYKVTVDGNEVATYTFAPKDATSNEIQWETVEPVEHPYPFTNVKGTELPHTGGIGTTIFYILGGLLVVGAVVILVARRKAQD